MSSSFVGVTFQMIKSKSTQSTELSKYLRINPIILESNNMIVFIHWINFRIQGKIFKCMISNLKKRMSFWRSKKLTSNLQEPSLFGLSFIFWQFKVNCLTVDYWLLIFVFSQDHFVWLRSKQYENAEYLKMQFGNSTTTN